jgi:hypothetical protein
MPPAPNRWKPGEKILKKILALLPRCAHGQQPPGNRSRLTIAPLTCGFTAM